MALLSPGGAMAAYSMDLRTPVASITVRPDVTLAE